MKKQLTKTLLSLVLVLSLLVGISSFRVAAEGEAKDEGDLYVVREAWSATPTNWNPLTWENSGDSDMLDMLSDERVGFTIAEDGVNWAWLMEGVINVRDVSAEVDAEKWGIEEGETGRAWEYELAPDQKWQDGTELNADSYVYSFQQLLDPFQKNRRADMFIANESEIVGAANYFNGDKAGQTRYTPVVFDEEADGYTEAPDGKYYVNLNEESFFFGGSPADYYNNEKYTDSFKKEDEDLFEKYGEWTEITEDIQADLNWLAAQFGYEDDEAWKEFACYEDGVYPEANWDEVGVLSDGASKITVIYVPPMTEFTAKSRCSSFPMVHEAVYEANKKDVGGGLVQSEYGTDLETTMSYGPYKMVSFEKDKQIVFERNENWYGYHDGKHEGQFNFDRYVVDIVPEATTRLQMFESGKNDFVGLQVEDFDRFRFSDYLLLTDLSYTDRWIFATSLKSLEALEKEQSVGNKRILHYEDFRKAISFSMDRQRLCKEATTAFKPAYFLFNNLYYLDIENDPESQYRKTDAGKEAVLRIYGVDYGEGTEYADIDEAYESVTGYDLDYAAELFTNAYNEAIADGNYEDGQDIVIRCMCSASNTLSPNDTRQQDLMNEFVAKATEGTPLEGKIRFEFLTGSATRYDDIANGKIEMIRGAWGGAYFYPYRTIGVYVDPDQVGGLNKIHESNGWNPTTEELTIVWDFNEDGEDEEVTKTLTEWYKILTDVNHEWIKDNNVRNKNEILSELESAIIMAYQCIPWGTETSATLYSMKVEYPTTEYNVMYGYGGLRLLKVNYTESEWENFLEKQGGILDYE